MFTPLRLRSTRRALSPRRNPARRNRGVFSNALQKPTGIGPGLSRPAPPWLRAVEAHGTRQRASALALVGLLACGGDAAVLKAAGDGSTSPAAPAEMPIAPGATPGGSNTRGPAALEPEGPERNPRAPLPAPDPATASEAAASEASESGPAAEPPPEAPAPPPEPSVTVPEPVSEPAVWGFGLGVTDVPAAVAFYTEVLGLSVERTYQRPGRSETVLYASEADRGARLILMNFEDARNTRNVTAKLVWQSTQASAINRKAREYPDYESRMSFGIVQFDGPETYIQEVGSIFDRGSGATTPYLVAMGFSVSDMSASRAFYGGALGMNDTRLGSFSVTDATGRGTITEFAMRHSAGAGLVLQTWRPARDSQDKPVMVVKFVPDAQAAANAVVEAGGSIVEQARRTEIYDNRLLIVAKDPDGYWLDLVQ